MEYALRMAVEQAPLPMLLHAEDGRILLVNQAWRDITGYSAAQLQSIGDWTLLAYGENRAVAVREGIRKLYCGDAPATEGEFVIRCKDGSLRTWDFCSVPAGRHEGGARVALSIATDVTARADALSALAEAEARYHMLFDANPCPMWVYDLETLGFLEVNDAAVSSYGHSRDEFLALTLGDIRPGEDVRDLLESVAHSRVTGGFERSEFWRHRRKDGSVFSVSITSHELEYAGRPARLVLAEDVTERLKARVDLARLTGELEQRVRDRTAELERLNNELETFAYTVSHDLKAPLRAIDGYSRLLQEDHGAALPGEAGQFVAKVRAGVARMGTLIDDLLAYSRMERRELHLGELDIDAIAASVADERAAELREAGGTLEVLCGGAWATGDPDAVRLVVRNYLDNAIKFRDPARKPCLAVRTTTETGRVLLSVSDNGVGFDMAFHDRVFDIFQRLHRAEDYPGTGIGLAIVRKAAQRMGGRVWADSRPGEGATFHLELRR